METAMASNSFTGQPGEPSTSTAFDEDARHYAVTASQVPKPTSSSLPPHSPFSDVTARDGKNGGTRFMEDCQENDMPRLSLRPSRLFSGKGKESILKEKEQKKPLCLLDLPVDILKDIVKEVTHTNDLTSLALCHSALHRLAIPHIYSRFDIVWPDTTTHAEPRSGVDALTYGLATLVMAEEIFRPARPASKDNNRFNLGGRGKATETTIRRRRGNHYAQFTRKFSLGNGPADWVQEYLITKEGGKMLGTLVALAVARMQSLETFIWDMPTGILRDVWLALSSLGDWGDERPCRLEKVWVRWHNNSFGDATHPMQHMPPPVNVDLMNAAPASLGQSQSLPLTQAHSAVLDRVEHPSFSVLPPLRSLSVLDIDELAYLDEMSVLIGNSRPKLRELRVGIARHTITREWVTVWEGDTIRQVDKEHPTIGTVTIGEKRLGGILGVLMGFVCDMRQPSIAAVAQDIARPTSSASEKLPSQPEQRDSEGLSEESTSEAFVTALDTIGSIRNVLPDVSASDAIEDEAELEIGSAATSPNQSTLQDEHLTPVHQEPQAAQTSFTNDVDSSLRQETEEMPALSSFEPDPSHLDGFLQLETLELERVPISVPVLQKGIDWSHLTSLTLLHCQNHEQLWKTLRRTFMPTPKSPTYPQARRSLNPSPKKNRLSFGGSELEMVYGLNLKKIHTNTVSPALVTFLKETLAPNSLEVLFLQEARSYSSSVTVDTLFRGPVRRHRGSLKKLLIDSSEKGIDGLPNSSSRWRRWMPSRDNLSFVCSGKMSSLRELGMAIDYNNWHFFLQHLPSIPHLRSLYIPFLADHVHGPTADPRELALQILDIVALRPEVELCYMGIANKCFEILENKREGDSRPDSRLGPGMSGMDDPTASDAEDDEDEEDFDEVDDDVDDLDDELDETESDEDDDDMDETDSLDDSVSSKHSARLRLREILFYDDKVAIFKARHGKL